MGVQALERRRVPRAADAQLERDAAVRPLPLDERPADDPLLLRRPLEVGAQRGIRAHRVAPALDAARRLEARHRCHEMAARQPVRRGERLAVSRVGVLLGHRRAPERTAHDYAPECPGLSSELSGHDCAIVHVVTVAGRSTPLVSNHHKRCSGACALGRRRRRQSASGICPWAGESRRNGVCGIRSAPAERMLAGKFNASSPRPRCPRR